MPEVFGARRRYGHLARRPVEEPQAKAPLEAANVRADHGPRKAEFIGGASEGTELGDPAECTHGLEVFQASIR
jgi:hypothetical protein